MKKKFFMFISIYIFILSFLFAKTWYHIKEFNYNPSSIWLDGWLNTVYIGFCSSSGIKFYKYANNNWNLINTDIYSLPYIFFKVYSDNIFLKASYIASYFYRYNGRFWVEIPNLNVATFFVKDAIVYFTTYNDNKLYVKKYTGTTTTLGLPFDYTYDLSIFVDNNHNVYLFVRNASNILEVNKWNGSNWSSLGTVGNGYGSASSIISTEYGLYVIYYQDNILYFKKYNGSDWETVYIFEESGGILSSNVLTFFGSNIYIFYRVFGTSVGKVFLYNQNIGLLNIGTFTNVGYQIGAYAYLDKFYITFNNTLSNSIDVYLYDNIYTPTVTLTPSFTFTPTVTPTITMTPDIIYYRSTYSTWIEGSIYMASPNGVTKVSILDRLEWFKDKDGYAVFTRRDRVQPNSNLYVKKNDTDIEFWVVDKSTNQPIDCSSNTCTIYFSVFKKP